MEHTPSSAIRYSWQDYRAYYSHSHGHHISGEIRIAPNVYSPQLGISREVLVYLPPSYGRDGRRYPVIYMQDGQNLFDSDTSYAGEWGVDETMELLGHQEGLEAIIVGIPNTGIHRIDEYSPFRDKRLGGGRGNDYVRFIAESLKPEVDREFRTMTERKYTGIMGSSMGGLISLYAYFEFAPIFGFAGVMSPSLWFAGGAIFDYVESAASPPGKIYLDAGTREYGESSNSGRLHRAAASRRYYASVRRMKGILVKKGYRPFRDVMHVEEKWAGHSESSWGRRLAPALRFLLTEALRQTSG
ncbi:MAG: esterase [Anaerolineae bacterium]|nr:MAG: esterase [Anaerolineae bacterium]